MTEGDRSRSPVPAGGRRGRAAQRGFTLVELMVALVVSSLLVGMIFAIFIRMSSAYRTQQQVAEVQSKLEAARARIELDAKQAGLRMSDGFYAAFLGAGQKQPPLRVFNRSNGPDQIAFYYADPAVQAATRTTVGSTCTRTACDRLDATAGFAVGDIVVMSTVTWDHLPDYPGPNEPKVAQFEACLLQLSSVGASSFSFSETGTWGDPGNTFCPNAPVVGTTVFYKLGVRHWRIDPGRPADGVLQLSRLGALVDEEDWQDQAYGFTDLQVSTRFFEPGDHVIDTADPDLDPQRDWYSSAGQANLTRPLSPDDFRPPIQVSITLVARTERDVEGIATSSTPRLTVAGNTENNTIGDRAAIPLPSVLPALSGNRILRYTTFQVDLRNIGVGR